MLFARQHGRVVHPAIVAARRRKDEPTHAGGLSGPNKLQRSTLVDGASGLRIACAGRITDDGGEMNDRIDMFDGAFNGAAVPNIADHEVEPWMPEHREKRPAPVHQVVENSNVVPFFDEPQRKNGSEVSGASRNENLHSPSQAHPKATQRNF